MRGICVFFAVHASERVERCMAMVLSLLGIIIIVRMASASTYVHINEVL